MKQSIALVLAPYYSRISPHLGLGYLRSALEAEGFGTYYHDFSAAYYREDQFVRGFYNRMMMSDGNSAYSPLESILKCYLGEKEIDQGKLLADKFIRSQAEEFAKTVLEEKPAAVGFSIYDSTLLFSLYIARAVKKMSPDTVNIFGGPFLADWDVVRIVNELHDVVDHVVIGEAERSLVELISYLEHPAASDYPKGCLALPADVDRDYARSELLTDLEAMPFPEYRGSPFPAYIENLRHEMINMNLHTTGEICLPVTMGRGCPYSCSFCGHNAYWTRYRLRSVAHVIEEMVRLHESYGCRVFRFNDSLINLKESWLDEFCDRLMKDNLKFYWYGHARADGINERIAEKMYAAGCRYLKFGLESASDRILELMNKKTDMATNRQAIRITDKTGMKCRANFIYCFPGETREEMESTIAFILENRPYYDVMRYMEFVLIPQSEIALNPAPFNVVLEPFKSRLRNTRIAGILNRIPRAWTSPDFTEDELNYRRRRVAETVGFIMEDEMGGIMPPTFPELIEERLTDDALVRRDDTMVSNLDEILKGGTRTAVLNRILPLETTPHEVEILRSTADGGRVGDLLKIERAAEGQTAGERKTALKKMLFKGLLKFTEKVK